MPAPVILKILADTAAYVAEMVKLQSAHKSVGESLQHGLEHGLERALLKAVALKEAAQAVTKAYKEASEKAAELNKESGSRAVGVAGNLATLGIKGTQAEGIIQKVAGASGASTPDEMAAFIGKLAEANRARVERYHDEKQGFTSRQIFEAINAKSQYGYGIDDSEFLKNFEDRYGYSKNLNVSALADQMAQDRLGKDGIPESVKEELSIRSYENQKRYEADLESVDRGRKARAGKAMLDKTKIFHPLAAAGVDVTNDASLGITGLIADDAAQKQVAQQAAKSDEVIRVLDRKTLANDSKQSE